MTHPAAAPLIVVVGPTASGKTAVAQAMAERLHAAILSADSMQIYRGMDIGTGKILPAERTVPYFGLDIVEPGQSFSAALFQRYGRRVVDDLWARDQRCIICGGTGFYVRAVVDAYDFPAGEQTGNAVRDLYNARVASEGTQAVWEELRDCDPASAAVINANDAKRVVRAFELLAAGTSYAQQHEQLAHIPEHYPACFIGLAVDPDILRARIDARVDAMVQAGLVEEVRRLLDQGLREALTANQAIGYKEFVAAFDGLITLGEAIEQVKIATHRYAKRQRTWFRKDKRITWLDANDAQVDRLTDEALACVDAWRAQQE